MVKRRKGKCRRAAAFFLSAAMTVVNGGTSYIPAYAADVGSSRFLLTNRELMQAIQDAKAAEDFFDFSSLDLKGKSEKAEERYEELLGEPGTVYQLDVDVDGSDAADGTKLELFYNEENEEVVFLYINESDESVRFTVNVDGYETKSLLVGAASAELTDGPETADGENGNSTEESTEETSGNSQETEGSDNVQNPGGSGSAGGGQGSGTGGNASEDSQEPETGDTADTEETGDAEEPSDGDAETSADDKKPESGDTGSAGNGEISEETGAAGDGAPADGEKPEDGGTGSVGNDDGAETGGDTGAAGDNGADGGAAGDVGSGEESGNGDTGSAGNGSGDGGSDSSSAGNNSGNSDSGAAGNDGGNSSSDTGTSDGGNSGSNTGTSDGGNSGSNTGTSDGGDSSDTGASGTSDGGDVQIGISAHSTAFVAVGSENKIATEGEWILEEGDTDGEEIPEVLGTLDGTVYPEVTVWEGAKAAACAVELEELEKIGTENGCFISYVAEAAGVVEIDGPSFAEEGESVSFSVIPEIGYQVTAVTANGVELDCAYETSPATPSKMRMASLFYVIDSVEEDQEIVVSTQAVSGTVFQAETEIASITITAPEGAFAVPVTLEAKDIKEGSGEYDTLKAQTDEKLTSDGYIMTSFHPIDMKFVDETGNEVEPAEAVKVNIHYKSGTGVPSISELEKTEEKKILHILNQEVVELDGTLIEEIYNETVVQDAEMSQLGVVANVTVKAAGEAEVNGRVYGTLEEAVSEAAAGAVIKLMAESIQLEDQIAVTKDVTIDMNSGMITAGRNKRVFIVKDGASLTLEGEGTVVGNGEVTGNGGLIHVGGEGNSDSSKGTFILKDSVILSGGTAGEKGGAVYVQNGNCIMEGGVIKDSEAIKQNSNIRNGYGGGGVYILKGTFEMKDGVIQETKATIGGGVFVQTNGEFLMSGGSIKNTEAGYHGGGVAVYEGKFHMTGGVISGAQATTLSNSFGGGVYLYGTSSSKKAQFTMENGCITGCHSVNTTGGVYAGEYSVFDMSGGSIENNSAKSSAGGVLVGATTRANAVAVFNLTGGIIRGNKVENTYFNSGGTAGNAGGVSVYGTFNMSGGVISDNIGVGGVYVQKNKIAKVNITGGAIYNNANNNTNKKENVSPISDIYLTYQGGNEFRVLPAKDMSDDLTDYKFDTWLCYNLSDGSDWEMMNGPLDEIAIASNHDKKFSFTAVTETDGREIYLDGVKGDDNKTGNSVLDAVKTFGTALEKAQTTLNENEDVNEVKIYVSDTVTVSGTETWEVPNEYAGKIILTRYRAHDGYMVEVSGSKANLTLKNLVMDGGKDKLSSNYIYTSSMILVQGEKATLNIEEGTVLRNNRAGSYSGISYDGGAVYVTGKGICNMNGGQITGNESSYAGGGITAARNAGFNMNGGVIENNVAGPHASGRAKGSGGGVAILEGSSMTMSGGTISGNQAGNGGGIHVGGEAPNEDYGDCKLTMTGGQIKENIAESAGGGMYVQCDSAAAINAKSKSSVEITGNRANANWHVIDGVGYAVAYAGGGIYVNGGRNGYNNGILNLTNVAISGNHAKGNGGGIGACPTSHLGIYVTDGAVIYGNHTDTENAAQIYSANIQANTRKSHTGYVSDYMLGGGIYLWKYDDGKQTGAAPRSYYQGPEGQGTYNAFYLDNDYDQEDVNNALNLATVVISDNYSGSNGGGIGTNGDLTIGVEKPDPATFKLQKSWLDGDNALNLRPETIEVTLKIERNDETTTKKVILKEENGWAWKLAAAEYCDTDGNLQATITIDEETMERYELNPESINVEEGTEGSGPMITISFENVFIPANGLTVYKVWKDGDNQDGLRPETISVQLYRNGEPMGDPVALSEATNWMYTWEDLPVRGQGQDLFYTVQEVGTVDGYTSEVGEPVKIDEDIYAVTIVNTHEPAVTKKTVTKVWDDNGNSDGLRPSSILVHLRADGEVVGEAELTAESGWTYTWEDLPVMDSGKTIKYTVEETAVPAGYMARYSEDTFTITNVHTPDGSDPTDPTDPDDPTPSNPGGSHGGGGGPDPGGSTPSGGPGVEVITPDEVPLANLPEESVEIPDEDVPLAALPKTGDAGHMGLKTVLFGALFAAFLSVRKRKEEQQ